MLQSINGKSPFKVAEMHEKYGPVVRIGVNELCYVHGQAWNDIYGQRPGLGQMEKADNRPIEGFGTVNMISANVKDHARCRRLMVHAFSDKALRQQEPLITQYVDLLMQRLRERSGQKADLTAWFNYTTFDLVGDLAFGEPFNCLKNSTYHPWISLIFNNVKMIVFHNAAARIPGMSKLLIKLAPKHIVEASKQHVELCIRQADKRMAEKTDRPDFMSYILAHNDKETGMTIPEIHANAYVVIIGGSETTATLLSGATYHLLRNPEVMKKLTTEIRSSFKSEKDITFATVSQLIYLLAVLNETLRIYPPVPEKLPRVVPTEGAIVNGRFVPGGTWVSVCHWAAYHSTHNFRDPDKFVPERWMGDSRYEDDKLDAWQPFSFGPRNCIGRNLAYMEMRLILARLVWGFDLELCEESQGWAERQKVYILWDKGPLWVKLKHVEREE